MRFLRRHMLAIGFGLALCVVAAIVGVSLRSMQDSVEAARLVVHTQQVLSTLQEIVADVEGVETAGRAYVITAAPQFARDAASEEPRIANALGRLTALVSDNPDQVQRAALLRLATDAKVRHVRELMLVRARDGFEPARAMTATGSGKQAMQRVRDIIRAMTEHEQSLLVQRRDATAREVRVCF